jgi:hypothetical protein
MESPIIKCTCQHEFQDKHLGQGRRYANPCKKGASLRCSVCSKEYPNPAYKAGSHVK